MAGTLLVANQDVVELLGAVEGFVERQHRSAGKTEDDVSPQFLEGTDYRLGTVDAFGTLTAAGRSKRGGTGVWARGVVHRPCTPLDGHVLWMADCSRFLVNQLRPRYPVQAGAGAPDKFREMTAGALAPGGYKNQERRHDRRY